MRWHAEVEAGRERRPDLPGNVDADRDGRGRRARRHPRPGHLHDRLVTLGEQRRGDREADLALLTGGDREGAHLVEVVAQRPQQRRVDEAPDDVVVDPGRFVGTQERPSRVSGPPERTRSVTELPGGTGNTMRPSAGAPAAAGKTGVGVDQAEAIARDHGAVGDLDGRLEPVELSLAASRPPAVGVARLECWCGRVRGARAVLGKGRCGHQEQRWHDGDQERRDVSHGVPRVTCSQVTHQPACPVPSGAWHTPGTGLGSPPHQFEDSPPVPQRIVGLIQSGRAGTSPESSMLRQASSVSRSLTGWWNS